VCGGNTYGQCGFGGDSRDGVLKPRRIEALSGHRIVWAACELRGSAFVSDAGLLFTCGEAAQGELGHGVQTAQITVPKQVTAVPQKVTSVAMSYQHMLVLLGTRVLEPVMCVRLAEIYLSFCLAADGQVMCCGQNTYGQCGMGSTTSITALTSIPLFQKEPARKLSCGYYHSGVVTKDNKCYMFGEWESGCAHRTACL
jgi:alpha-tubulin suppressor-like RCC1 family protein